MSELFISYGRKNRDIVEPIVTLLKELGVVAWMDSGIQAGERYRREIRSQLKDAKAVLVCWSPEALDSDWVDYEADIALEYGTYVPVLLAPCALQPPFSSFQTPDLSKWNGQPTHPDWLMLIDKIAEKVDRKGITEAARAMASNDDQTRYNFSKNYPDEPLARKLWLTYEARHREEFNQLLAAARDRVRTRINHQYVDLDARLAGAVPALEAWLAEERRGTAKEPRPDPSAIIDGRDVADEAELRSEIASLSGNLSRAKSREDQLNEELRRLSQSLVEAAEETKRFREEGVSLQQELRAAKSETERISLELQSVTLNKEKLVNQNARAAADSQLAQELEIAKNVAADGSRLTNKNWMRRTLLSPVFLLNLRARFLLLTRTNGVQLMKLIRHVKRVEARATKNQQDLKLGRESFGKSERRRAFVLLYYTLYWPTQDLTLIEKTLKLY